jgi:3-isopropylmalate dehydrogenase
VTNFSIALVPGDGVGAEVMAEALKLLRATQTMLDGVHFCFSEYSVGAAAYLADGDPMPEAIFQALARSDAILLAAIGLPDVRLPSGTEISPHLDLRERLDLYCGLRPVRLFHRDHTPLKKYEAGEIDLLLIRESTEGLFSSRRAASVPSFDLATDIMRITRAGSERLFHAAFRQAQTRRRLLTLVDKANVLPSMAFFRSVFDEVAGHYPDVRTERVYVDAAALRLVQKPESLDVIVTENMFGDILSDLAASLAGGMGMAPSADVGDHHGVFQPAHGSAPDIAGSGLANPVATILSAAMMLEWLGHSETRRGAAMIRRAVESVLGEGAGTPDLGGALSTSEMGDLLIERLQTQV